MLRTLAISTLILVGAASIAHAADVYRWVDDHGSVHYSDKWVPGSQLIKATKPHPAAPEAEASQRVADQQKLTKESERISTQLTEENNAKAVKQDVTKMRDQQCKDAKDRYEKSIEARRIYKTTKDGEREYISDADTDAYRLKARTDVQEFCGSAPK
jgi:hypothetical protein